MSEKRWRPISGVCNRSQNNQLLTIAKQQTTYRNTQSAAFFWNFHASVLHYLQLPIYPSVPHISSSHVPVYSSTLKTPPLKLKIIRSHSVSLQQMLTCTIQIWTYLWNVTVNITNERESLFVRGSNNKAYRNSFVVPTVIFGDGGVTVKGAYRTRALDF